MCVLVEGCISPIEFGRRLQIEAPADLFGVLFGRNVGRWHFHSGDLYIFYPGKRQDLASHLHRSANSNFTRHQLTSFGKVSDASHQGPVVSVTVAGNGSFFATGGVDGTIIISNVKNGKNLAKIDAHSGPVLAVHASDDGALVASIGKEGRLKLWQRE
jgi:WD40 repeat protein